jgi:hypothetical protein
MSAVLAKYETRLQDRALLSAAEMMRLDDEDFVNLKFTREGKIKPIYGLTCIIWVTAGSLLFQQLCNVKTALQNALAEAGLAQFFAFLEPASYHMTICDISASSTPLTLDEVEATQSQIQAAFADSRKIACINAQVHGIGLTSTITALVHFQREAELKKVLRLESQIKQSTGTNKRDFLGHITLAYGIKAPQNQIEQIREILQPFREYRFGELETTTFDLTCFTDMNTFIPLTTVDFRNNQMEIHDNLEQCQCKLH